MKIPESLDGIANAATVGEVERINWLDRRIKTLKAWIAERDTLGAERDKIVAAVKARVPAKPADPKKE